MLLIYTNRVISLATLKLQAAVMIPMIILTSVEEINCSLIFRKFGQATKDNDDAITTYGKLWSPVDCSQPLPIFH